MKSDGKKGLSIGVIIVIVIVTLVTCVFSIKERLDVGGTLTTTLKQLSWVDDTIASELTCTKLDNLTSTGADGAVYTVEYNGATCYYINLQGDKKYTLSNGKQTPNTITVSAYDADGNLIASATLTK